MRGQSPREENTTVRWGSDCYLEIGLATVTSSVLCCCD